MLVNGILLHVDRKVVDDALGTVIVTHGIAEHSGRYQVLTETLKKAGFTVVLYDLRGHGQSQGKRGHVRSFQLFIDDLHVLVEMERALGAKKIFLFGHSMGGLIVDMYGVKYGAVDGIIASAAPTSFVKDILPLRLLGYQWLGWAHKKTNFADDQLSRMKDVEEAYLNDPLNLKRFSLALAGQVMVGGVRYLNAHIKKFLTPVLILHGEDDKIVPAAFSERFFEVIPTKDKKLILYPEAYHEILNDYGQEKVREDIVSWLTLKAKEEKA
ncbi:MAG: lysophospholipase [Acholeplasmataceae bacterium]|nr:lysophospholipase [Acholeplasmataceae bacterium]